MVFYEYEDISYGEIMRRSIRLSRTYSHLLSLKSLGFSHDGREIIAIYLGDISNKKVLFTAGVHGRENINPVVFLMIIEEYCKRYESDTELKECLEKLTFVFVPVVNPDGYEIAKKGFGAIRNRLFEEYCKSFGIPSRMWKYNARGVDINRNFNVKSFRPTVNMPYSSSENETIILEKFFIENKPVGYMDVHSRGKVIYWYRNTMSEIYNIKQYNIARKLAKLCNYGLVSPELELDEGGNGGNTVHFASEMMEIPAITVETVDDDVDFPLDINNYEKVFSEIKELVLKFALLL